MASVIRSYLKDTIKSSVVHELDGSLRKLFGGLDELQALHKLLNNELETTYYVTNNISGLSNYHKTLLLNYGANYQPLSDLFNQHYLVCDDIIKISANKILLAEKLDEARLKLLQGLAVHRLKDVELTYHITHDPVCRGFVLKLIGLDKQFKKAIETRDKKFDELHSKIYSMIRVQQELVNTFGSSTADLIPNSANKNFINMIAGRTGYLDDLLHKCIKKHQTINEKVLRDVFKSFEKYRQYNNIDINFKAAYVSDGTFDENFKMYRNLSSALEKSINSLKQELDETEVREKLGFDARQKKVLIATNPLIVSLEGKRSAVKRNLNTRAIENISIFTNIKDCVAKHGKELDACFANLEGFKKNDISAVQDYMKYAEKLKKMKGMNEKYYHINATLARKIVEIAQYQEKDTLNTMVGNLAEKNKAISDLEQKLADEKARAADVARTIQEKARDQGYSLDAANNVAQTGETGDNVLRKIQGAKELRLGTLAGGGSEDYGMPELDSLMMAGGYDEYVGEMTGGADDNINEKTAGYRNHALMTGMTSTTRFGPLIIKTGISPSSLVNTNSAAKLIKESNPLIYMATGGNPGLMSSKWTNPLTGYQFQLNIIDGGVYGHMLRNEYESYDRCVANNKITLNDAINKDLTTVNALPNSDPRKATLYNELIKIKANIDNYAQVHACGTTYERMINGINSIGFDRIKKDPGNTGHKLAPAEKKHGNYTPVQVEQMMMIMDTYIELYSYIIMDFDSRCRTTEELIQNGHEILNSMILDLQNDHVALNDVKQVLNQHKGKYFSAIIRNTTLFAREPEYSLRDYVYNISPIALQYANTDRAQIIEDLNNKIKFYEELKTQYRYLKSLVDKNEINFKTYYSQYIAHLDKINDNTIAIFRTAGNESPGDFILQNYNLISDAYACYIGTYQAITQIIFIIYAHVKKYNIHHQTAVQERINHYASLSREYFNNALKVNAVSNELLRIYSIPAANGLIDILGMNLRNRVTNIKRYNILDKIKDNYKTLDTDAMRNTFKKFTNSKRLNVNDIPYTSITDALSAMGDFKNNLADYAKEVARESNVISEYMNQLIPAYKTCVKMWPEQIFYEVQLHMIEVFNLPKTYYDTTLNRVMPLKGLYPTYNVDPTQCDQKTNREFIVFLGRRMLENGTLVQGGTGKWFDSANDVEQHVAKNGIIRGGSNISENPTSGYKILKKIHEYKNTSTENSIDSKSEAPVKIFKSKTSNTYERAIEKYSNKYSEKGYSSTQTNQSDKNFPEQNFSNNADTLKNTLDEKYQIATKDAETNKNLMQMEQLFYETKTSYITTKTQIAHGNKAKENIENELLSKNDPSINKNLSETLKLEDNNLIELNAELDAYHTALKTQAMYLAQNDTQLQQLQSLIDVENKKPSPNQEKIIQFAAQQQKIINKKYETIMSFI